MAEQYAADRPMPYTPDEAKIRECLRDGMGEYADIMDEWLDRFLARVKRDAAREALDGLAAAEHRATRAEERIKAVEAVLDESEADTTMHRYPEELNASVRYALDGDS